MKKILIALAFLTAFVTNASAQQQQTDTYFPYPIIPDSISSLQDRSDFLVTHFWDFCDLKKAFNNKQKMGEAFSTYLEFMPYASAKTAHRAIAKLLKDIEKQPADVLFLAQKAQELVHSDTSYIYSDEIFLPFARAAAENKKIGKDDREPFERITRILSSTQTGMPAPEFNYTDRQGNLKTFAPDSSEVTVIFFVSPDCPDCTLDRSRLNADIKASGFVNDGVMRILAINPYPDPEGKWPEAAKRYPENWEVGIAPNLDEIYDIKTVPSFYVIDDDNVIQLKNININTLINLIIRL